jgi:hypothetical protein
MCLFDEVFMVGKVLEVVGCVVVLSSCGSGSDLIDKDRNPVVFIKGMHSDQLSSKFLNISNAGDTIVECEEHEEFDEERVGEYINFINESPESFEDPEFEKAKWESILSNLGHYSKKNSCTVASSNFSVNVNEIETKKSVFETSSGGAVLKKPLNLDVVEISEPIGDVFLNDASDKKEEIVIDPIKQLQDSVNAIEKTLEIVKNPENLDGLESLPEPNKAILLDVASMLVEDEVVKFSMLKTALEKGTTSSAASFYASAEMINWGRQTDQNYNEYTNPFHPELLLSLAHCFIVSKTYESLGEDPTVSIEDLQILIQKSIDYSGGNGYSKQLLETAKQLKKVIV